MKKNVRIITTILLISANLFICCSCVIADIPTVDSTSSNHIVQIVSAVPADSLCDPDGTSAADTDDTTKEAETTSVRPPRRELPAPEKIVTLDDYFASLIQPENDLTGEPGLLTRLLDASTTPQVSFDELEVISFYYLDQIIPERSNHFIKVRDRISLSLGRATPQMKAVCKYYPIQIIAKIDEDNVFMPFKTECNGRIIYILAVYTKIMYDNFEWWASIGENYYFSELYSLKDFETIKAGEILPEDFLIKHVMISPNGMKMNRYNDCRVQTVYDENDPKVTKEIIHKAAIPLKDGVAVITSSSPDMETYERLVLDVELFKYGESCEKYPAISILRDGFYPPLPY